MSRDGIWLTDPATGSPTYYDYAELDPDVLPQLWKPVGGFCYPASSFLRLPLPEVPFYLRGWLPKQGKAMLYGQAKAGKSFLSIQLAQRISCGDDFLTIPTEKASVLYLQFELGEGVLQARMKSTGQNYDNVYVGTTFSMKLDKSAGQEQLLNAVSAINPNVVILDPFYKLISGDENESHDVLTILNFLDDVIALYNCSIFIIHHAGKDLERGGRGSSVLEGWVDACLEMKRTSKKGEPLRCEIVPKVLRHAGLPPEATAIELNSQFEFELQAKEKKLTVYDKVLQRLNKDGSVTAGELIRAGNTGKRKAIYEALSRLVEDGMAEKSGITYYRKGEEKAVKESIGCASGEEGA